MGKKLEATFSSLNWFKNDVETQFLVTLITHGFFAVEEKLSLILKNNNTKLQNNTIH